VPSHTHLPPQTRTVSVAVNSPSLVSEGGSLTFTFTLDAAAQATLDVGFTFGSGGTGIATCGNDYSTASAVVSFNTVGSTLASCSSSGGMGTVRFLAGATTSAVSVPFASDGTTEGLESLTATITTGTYTIGASPAATGYVTDVPVRWLAVVQGAARKGRLGEGVA
jgi:hypothetical protein